MIAIQAFLCAVSFLTRIPVPGRGSLPPRVAGLSVAFFPLVGLLLGGASAGVAWALRDRLGLPAHSAWTLLLVSLHALLTGALHLDGVSDVADGLGGGRGDRERALEIMKDTRVGAFGVVALILVLIGKVVAMDEVLRMPGYLAMLLAYPLVARFAVVPLIVFFPCARPTGLARTFHEQSRWPAALVAAGLAGVAMWVLGKTLFITAGIGVGVGLVVGILIASRLRGLTGDAYGASIELSELAFLLAAAFPRIRGG